MDPLEQQGRRRQRRAFQQDGQDFRQDVSDFRRDLPRRDVQRRDFPRRDVPDFRRAVADPLPTLQEHARVLPLARVVPERVAMVRGVPMYDMLTVQDAAQARLDMEHLERYPLIRDIVQYARENARQWLSLNSTTVLELNRIRNARLLFDQPTLLDQIKDVIILYDSDRQDSKNVFHLASSLMASNPDYEILFTFTLRLSEGSRPRPRPISPAFTLTYVMKDFSFRDRIPMTDYPRRWVGLCRILSSALGRELLADPFEPVQVPLRRVDLDLSNIFKLDLIPPNSAWERDRVISLVDSHLVLLSDMRTVPWRPSLRGVLRLDQGVALGVPVPQDTRSHEVIVDRIVIARSQDPLWTPLEDPFEGNSLRGPLGDPF